MSIFRINDVVVIGALLAFALFESANLGNGTYAKTSGEKVFQASCASCHPRGGNIVESDKPVAGSKKLASREVFKSFIAQENGSMPAFQQIAGSAADVDALYAYCKTLK